jgi:hypothetical protein
MTTQPQTPAALLSAAVVYGSNPPQPLPIQPAPAAKPVGTASQAKAAR